MSLKMELIDLKMKMENDRIEGKISGSSYGELSDQPSSNEVVSQEVTKLEKKLADAEKIKVMEKN